MKILFCISNWDGCGYYRVQIVSKYLNKIPGIQTKIVNHIAKSDLRWCDLAVFQKLTNDNATPYFEYAKLLGRKTILEVDDDYFALEKHNPAYKYFTPRASLMKRRSCLTSPNGGTGPPGCCAILPMSM